MYFYNLNDNELIYYVKEHNNQALKMLITKYMILSKKIIRDMKFNDLDSEEALSNCNELILKCIRLYNKDFGSFYSYYVVSLKRVLLKMKEKQKKISTLNEDDYVRNFHQIHEKRNEKIFNYLSRSTEFQKKIANMILEGYSVNNISKKLNVPKNKIYYELKKINKEE